jgi:hypothetical protein
VAGCYSLVVRVLDKYAGGKGLDVRTSITAVVPKSHSMHLPVTALVEVVIAPNSQSEAQLQETAKKAKCDSLTRDIVMAHDVVRKDLKMSVGFAIRSTNNRSYRGWCFALALLVLCVPQVSAMATTTPPDSEGASAHGAELAQAPPVWTLPLTRVCADEVNSFAFDLRGAPMPCSYFSAQPSACASYSIARITCPVAWHVYASPAWPLGPNGLGRRHNERPSCSRAVLHAACAQPPP